MTEQHSPPQDQLAPECGLTLTGDIHVRVTGSLETVVETIHQAIIATPAAAMVVMTTADGQQTAVNVQHIVRIDPVPRPPDVAPPAVPQGRRGDRYKVLRPLPGT